MLPTRVYRVPMEKHDAGATIPLDDSTRYRILIWDELEEHEACESLVHEWAHAVRGTFCKDVHDSLYWIEHGRCYRIWERIIESLSQP
jgi:hypothetical protein